MVQWKTAIRGRLGALFLGVLLLGVMLWLALGAFLDAPGDRAAGIITANAQRFLRASSCEEVLEWVAEARITAPELDRALVQAREALGYDLLDRDTWRGLGVELDRPVVAVELPAPPMDRILVLAIPTLRGSQALAALDLLFARLPPAQRPRVDRDVHPGVELVHLWRDGRLVAALLEMDEHVYMALPRGAGDREEALDGWLQRTMDPGGARLWARPEVRDALREHRATPLLELRLDEGIVAREVEPVEVILELADLGS